jgi:hypothetical protein
MSDNDQGLSPAEDMSDQWQWYLPKAARLAEMRPWTADYDMTGVSVSDTDKANGHPKEGDMIRRNPSDSKDQWLMTAAYFAEHFNLTPRG